MSDWRESAACSNRDLDLFYPIGHTGPAIEQTRRAKAVCRRCPVQVDCLLSSLQYAATDQHGIQGGLTADERCRYLKPCPRGHERSAATVGVEVGVPYCIPCRTADVADYWEANGPTLAEELAQVRQLPSTASEWCSHGVHAMTPDNIYYVRGGRRCRGCAASRQHEYRQRKGVPTGLAVQAR